MSQSHMPESRNSHQHGPHHHHSTARAHASMAGHGSGDHNHAGMVADYRRRFWVALALTVPILLLSPAGAHGLGLIGSIVFPGSHLVLLALSSVVYFYGGWPFLAGLPRVR